MFSKLHVGRLWVLALLLLLLGALRPVAAQQQTPVDRAVWAQRLIDLQPNTLESYRTFQDFLQLDPDVVYELVRDNWSKIPSTDTKTFLLTQLGQGDNPHVLEILHLGAVDPAVTIQNRALAWVEGYSFHSFTEDYNAYRKWHEQSAGKPLEEVMRASALTLATALSRADPTEQMNALNLLQRITGNNYLSRVSRLRRQVLFEAGIPDIVARWLSPQPTGWMCFQVLRALHPDEAFQRRVFLPLIGKNDEPNLRRLAINALASPESRWASDTLLKMMLDEYPDSIAEGMGQTLAQIGDPHALPTLIGIMDADNTPEGARVLGNILAQFTGVSSASLLKADWWHAWWQKNSLRFPEEIRALPIPRVAIRARPVVPGPRFASQEPVVSPHPEQHQIANDPKRAYWLISPGALAGGLANAAPPPAPPVVDVTGRRAPGVGPGRPVGGKAETVKPASPPPSGGASRQGPALGLLVVLTGDGNGADSVTFWSEMAQKALHEGYYIALAVAPKWSAAQSRTWLTRSSLKQVKEAKFSTESFVADIVKDISATHKIDPNRVFLHGVSEGGPVVYACSLEETTPFKGFYLLSSAFKSSQLPPLSHARGRRYYLQHSQDDRVSPYWMAEAAQKMLTEQGAVVKLAVYRGDHGYTFTDDVGTKIGEAVTWMEAQK
jgi:predicted esterase